MRLSGTRTVAFFGIDFDALYGVSVDKHADN